LNKDDTIKFKQSSGTSIESTADEHEVFRGEVQVHTDLCPVIQIRLGLKVQAGFTGMVNKYSFDNREVHSAKTLGLLGVPRLSRLIIHPVPTQPWQERPYRPRGHWTPPWMRKRIGHVTKAEHAKRFADEQKRLRLEEERRNPKPAVPKPKVIFDSYEKALMESDDDDSDCGGGNKKKRKQPQAATTFQPAPPPPPRFRPLPPSIPPPRAPARPPPPPLSGYLSQRLGPSQEEEVSWQEDCRRGSYGHVCGDISDQHADKRRRYNAADDY